MATNARETAQQTLTLTTGSSTARETAQQILILQAAGTRTAQTAQQLLVLVKMAQVLGASDYYNRMMANL